MSPNGMNTPGAVDMVQDAPPEAVRMCGPHMGRAGAQAGAAHPAPGPWDAGDRPDSP
nr:hypothetical protein OG781_15970 [Streptomyces sp. NBC_00830]